MLRQVEVVQLFMSRRRGTASGLRSTGEELLDHGWYLLARWEGEEILWNPLPYPSRSSSARFSLVKHVLSRAFSPVELREPGLVYAAPYCAVLRRGPGVEWFPCPHPAGTFYRNAWDVRENYLLVEGECFWGGDLKWALTADVEYLKKRAWHRKRSREAAERAEALMERYWAVALALGPEVYERALRSCRGNGFQRLKRAEEFIRFISALLSTESGASALLGGMG